MKSYFPNIAEIKYEGPRSNNPFSFKYYNANEVILGKKMKEHLRFAMSYWHTLSANGSDQFGSGTMIRPWNQGNDDIEIAKNRVMAGFEFMEKIGIKYFCFHDRDIAPERETLEETNKAIDEIVDVIEKQMKKTDIKLLWGTACLFSNPRFVHGAATSPNADIFAYSAAQVKKALEITERLNGQGYVFWGGREGYETLLNTNTRLEEQNLARFFKMAVKYAEEIGFKGQFYIEPKPKEPAKHQYDFDTSAVASFLRKYGLAEYFKINIETNHATLAGHTFQHELRNAIENDLFGSVDANYGDLMLGWDTDQFPTNIYDSTLAMYEILKAGGFKTGGLNFDAKVRRASFEPEDLFLAYIAGMDTYARGLKVAVRLLEDRVFENFIDDRYSSYKDGIGKEITGGRADFRELEEYVLKKKKLEPNKSGRQEYLENILNQYIFETSQE